MVERPNKCMDPDAAAARVMCQAFGIAGRRSPADGSG